MAMTDKEKTEAVVLARFALGDDVGQSTFWQEVRATLDHIDRQERPKVERRLTQPTE
jgi:hypothetical protein